METEAGNIILFPDKTKPQEKVQALPYGIIRYSA